MKFTSLILQHQHLLNFFWRGYWCFSWNCYCHSYGSTFYHHREMCFYCKSLVFPLWNWVILSRVTTMTDDFINTVKTEVPLKCPIWRVHVVGVVWGISVFTVNVWKVNMLKTMFIATFVWLHISCWLPGN